MNIKNTITPPVTDDNLPPVAPRKSKAPLVTLIISRASAASSSITAK